MRASLFSFSFLFLSYLSQASSDLTPFLQKFHREEDPQKIKNIDGIYIINIDGKERRFDQCLEQLSPYKISATRFPAVNGWSLPPQTIREVGLVFQEGMQEDDWVLINKKKESRLLEHDFLRKELYGETVFFPWITLGGIGCALSHLSVLEYAYQKKDQRIWVMEDDVIVKEDPHQISLLIEKLESLVGQEGWDILYTDTDKRTRSIYPEEEDFESDLKSDLWFYSRPDVGLKEQKILAHREVISDDFVKIGSRIGAYSMIVNRTGMKKILDFLKSHHLFLPYDHELGVVPDLKMFNLRKDIISVATTEPSGTDYHQNQYRQKIEWDHCKKTTLAILEESIGWKDPIKAEKLMDFLEETRPSLVVEIGSFGGYITLAIGKSLQFFNQGKVIAIDAWNVEAATQGLAKEERIDWWKTIDMQATYLYFEKLLSAHQILGNYCKPIKALSKDAAPLIEKESVDLLFVDGNESDQESLKDVILYLPKVKKNGYIWLDHAGLKKKTVSYLMKNCDWMQDKILGIDCLIFRKRARTL